MMNEKLDWTTKLGDAFLAQQADVLKTAQALRVKAEAAGNLKTSQEMTVKKETEDNVQVIKIEQPNPRSSTCRPTTRRPSTARGGTRLSAALLLLPAGLRLWRGPRVRHRHRRRRRDLGRRWLGPQRDQHQHQPLQQLQQDQHLERQLEPQRRPPQGRGRIATPPRRRSTTAAASAQAAAVARPVPRARPSRAAAVEDGPQPSGGRRTRPRNRARAIATAAGLRKHKAGGGAAAAGAGRRRIGEPALERRIFRLGRRRRFHALGKLARQLEHEPRRRRGRARRRTSLGPRTPIQEIDNEDPQSHRLRRACGCFRRDARLSKFPRRHRPRQAAAKPAAAQHTFATPEEAAAALADAVRAKSVDDLLAVVGPTSRDWLFTGDKVAERERLEQVPRGVRGEEDVREAGRREGRARRGQRRLALPRADREARLQVGLRRRTRAARRS